MCYITNQDKTWSLLYSKQTELHCHLFSFCEGYVNMVKQSCITLPGDVFMNSFMVCSWCSEDYITKETSQDRPCKNNNDWSQVKIVIELNCFSLL